jgi:uncharacterized protein YprB with RNaseH-like and TPR domain
MNTRTTREKLDKLFPSPHKRNNDSLYSLEKEVLGSEASSEGELSVKERLERLLAVTKARPRTLPSPAIARPEALELGEVLDGEEVSNDFGSFYSVDKIYPLAHFQGRIQLARLTNVPREAFSMLSRGDDVFEIDLKEALFLDTETTGLAGGAGTCAFLIGLGWVENESFVLRQLFMRDYGEEAAMLHALGEILARFELLVSYNGKSFDIPLLETRFVLTRQRLSFEHLLHFDLLHPARSLWKARIESCRLMELEHRLLELEREDDIPGHMIPDLFFRFLRTGDAIRLDHVFLHNRHDILSLAALTICASDLLDESHVPEDPLDDLSLGRLFERSAQPERSMMHYSRAVEAGLSGAARRRALAALADQHKRRGDIDDARKLWGELADGESVEVIQALHELAMLSEHRERDFTQALGLCERALSYLDENYELTLSFRFKWRDAFAHRRSRLKKRLAKSR